MNARRRLRAGAVGLATAALTVTLSGCGSASEPSPPTGVDGLVIPTPDPDPQDFVTTVDNPWFPVLAGARWTYTADDGSSTTTVVAEAGPTIDGVATSTLVATTVDALGSRVVRDHYAQDEDGNVWWFGREGEWQAGRDGATAGLAMPAEPRFGDGFVQADRTTGQVIAAVTDVDAEAPSGLEDFGPVVVLEVTDGGVVTESFARDVGLVKNESAELVSYDEPR